MQSSGIIIYYNIYNNIMYYTLEYIYNNIIYYIYYKCFWPRYPYKCFMIRNKINHTCIWDVEETWSMHATMGHCLNSGWWAESLACSFVQKRCYCAQVILSCSHTRTHETKHLISQWLSSPHLKLLISCDQGLGTCCLVYFHGQKTSSNQETLPPVNYPCPTCSPHCR